ncbi:Kunitz/Bovine pancreatic trypsin inhibitor domain protein [Ancylostoma duodenale]|uniref:Kunitz/Bovine pancreatic trypsin inhibitor domain protein n=1 Tax=Ancylostoma duodenale TaxID=51022 RepID=A0A0C2G1Z6_9BILA|nr:Kunitz/Bovine pancreatic trypsin inhibitor domain protein [Ancylostoma duodenale]
MRPLLLALFLVIFFSLCIYAKDSYDYKYQINKRCLGRRYSGPRRCKARIERFSYSTSKGKCVRFFYSGCSAGPNNFKTKKACVKACERFGYKS